VDILIFYVFLFGVVYLSRMQFLTTDQKQQHVSVCEELCQITYSDAAFLSRVVTGDESWIYGYDLEAKQQCSQWKSPDSPRLRMMRQVKQSQEHYHHFL
jgi:hypothetical protein